MSYGEAIAVPCLCRHCGDLLLVIAEHFSPIRIIGLRDLLVVHATSRSPFCQQTFVAEPYDHFELTRAYELLIARGQA